MFLSDSRNKCFSESLALCGDLIKCPVLFNGRGQACESDLRQTQGEACAALPTLH